MQKILNIDGHDVLLESNAATIFYYKEQFGHDFMRDLMRIVKAMGEKTEISDLSWDDIDHLDISSMYQIAWACAKTAKYDIAPPIEWLSQFSRFSNENLSDIMTLVSSTIGSKKN